MDVNNLYGWTMPKKVAVNNDFEWIKDTSQFNEDFIKNCNEKSDEGNFLDLMFNILKNYMKFIMVYYFCQNEWKLKKSNGLKLIYMIKLDILYTYEI